MNFVDFRKVSCRSWSGEPEWSSELITGARGRVGALLTVAGFPTS